MKEQATRLLNCDNALKEIFSQTDDEELKALIRGYRSPIQAMLAELDDPRPDTDKEVEAVLAQTMARIRLLKLELEGAKTERSPTYETDIQEQLTQEKHDEP